MNNPNITVTFKRAIMVPKVNGSKISEFKTMKIKGLIGERVGFVSDQAEGLVSYLSNRGLDADGIEWPIGIGFELDYEEWFKAYGDNDAVLKIEPKRHFYESGNVKPVIVTVPVSNIDSESEGGV